MRKRIVKRMVSVVVFACIYVGMESALTFGRKGKVGLRKYAVGS